MEFQCGLPAALTCRCQGFLVLGSLDNSPLRLHSWWSYQAATGKDTNSRITSSLWRNSANPLNNSWAHQPLQGRGFVCLCTAQHSIHCHYLQHKHLLSDFPLLSDNSASSSSSEKQQALLSVLFPQLHNSQNSPQHPQAFCQMQLNVAARYFQQ